MFRRTFMTATAAIALAGSAAFASGEKDIVDTAVDAGTFTTLLATAETAGLVDTLKGDGPMTVFAPTDEASAALPEGTVEMLLMPENRSMLVNLLSYHVALDNYAADDLDAETTAITAQGGSLVFSEDNGKKMVKDAEIIQADIQASNGTIHVSDKVLELE